MPPNRPKHRKQLLNHQNRTPIHMDTTKTISVVRSTELQIAKLFIQNFKRFFTQKNRLHFFCNRQWLTAQSFSSNQLQILMRFWNPIYCRNVFASTSSLFTWDHALIPPDLSVALGSNPLVVLPLPTGRPGLPALCDAAEDKRQSAHSPREIGEDSGDEKGRWDSWGS